MTSPADGSVTQGHLGIKGQFGFTFVEGPGEPAEKRNRRRPADADLRRLRQQRHEASTTPAPAAEGYTAFWRSASQMLILCVSGMMNRRITKQTAGTTMG